MGNRTASHQGSSYSYQAFNRLTAANSNAYAYNANGNLTSKTDASGSWTYTWDFENHLKQASQSGGVTVTYAYDALGRRVERTSSAGGTTKFVYDVADVLRDLDGTGNTIADYLNGPGLDNKLRQASGGTALYFVQDHLGITRALTDASGSVASSLDYDSYGNITSGAPATRYTYTGREIETDVGLIYYRARWYDPQQGRFISEDPIGLLAGMNLYSYVRNNPIWANDPLGLASIFVVVGPRSNGGSGGAYILLLDKNGNRINACGCDEEYFSGLAVAGSPNRMLGNGVGDTPFGVYNFSGIQGGQPSSRLGDGFGTGKILMDGVFGEIVDSGRSLMRLHGGGSGLRRRNQDPYAPEHDLLPTQGCVRMKNGDVNALIDAIKNLPKDDPLEFIFVGDSTYLHNLSTDPNPVNRRWQPVLRTNLGLPATP